jgi:hypothetical protein
MNRLERAAVFLLLAVVVPQIIAHYPNFSNSFDEGGGRRPLPAPEDATPPSLSDAPPPSACAGRCPPRRPTIR